MPEFNALDEFANNEKSILNIKCPNECENAYLEEVVLGATVVLPVVGVDSLNEDSITGEAVIGEYREIFHRCGMCNHNFGTLDDKGILAIKDD